MLDRYIFKAKRMDNGEWVQGSLFKRGVSTYIALSMLVNPIANAETNVIVVEVNENSICQCTGLKGMNGNMLWENDIAEINGKIYLIEWYKDAAKFVMNRNGFIIDFENFDSYEVEVIGNRFDNPEILN